MTYTASPTKCRPGTRLGTIGWRVRAVGGGRAESRFIAVSRVHSGGGVPARAVVVLDLFVAQGHRVYVAAAASADRAVVINIAGGHGSVYLWRLAAVSMR